MKIISKRKIEKESEPMTRKLWFQVGVGILITLLIIKYFIEIHSIFNPIIIIFTTPREVFNRYTYNALTPDQIRSAIAHFLQNLF